MEETLPSAPAPAMPVKKRAAWAFPLWCMSVGLLVWINADICYLHACGKAIHIPCVMGFVALLCMLVGILGMAIFFKGKVLIEALPITSRFLVVTAVICIAGLAVAPMCYAFAEATPVDRFFMGLIFFAIGVFKLLGSYRVIKPNERMERHYQEWGAIEKGLGFVNAAIGLWMMCIQFA